MSDQELFITDLMSSREKFNDFVYTPADEAITELKRRWADPSIETVTDIPPVCKNGFTALLYVAVITPNFEILKYITESKRMGLKPVIFEQLQDKFTPNNQWKKMLGKMSFCDGWGKKGGLKCERINIIDFNNSNGKRISDVKTLWGDALSDFHHALFFKNCPHLSEDNIYDASDWFLKHGGTPMEYYKSFLSLLIKHGIQFENFYLDEKESNFTRDVFLPAFISVCETTKLKPLIVALEDFETEGDEYWYSHPIASKSDVLRRID